MSKAVKQMEYTALERTFAGVRGNYVESVTVSATMSPGIRVTV